MKIFLDANVLFSSANPGSRLQEFFWLLIRDHEVFTSDFALEEARRNVQAKRTAWWPEFIRIREAVTVVGSVNHPLPVDLPAKDRPILATAIHHRCDVLLTGDQRHFGPLFQQEVEGTRVLSPLLLARECYG